MQIKQKICVVCQKPSYIWKSHKKEKYCKSCWYKSKEKNSKPLQKKPINKKSKKITVLDNTYTIIRRKFMEKKPMCEAALPGCTISSTDVHHKKGRGFFYLDVESWLSVCRNCHVYIEEHPDEAIELGFSDKRI